MAIFKIQYSCRCNGCVAKLLSVFSTRMELRTEIKKKKEKPHEATLGETTDFEITVGNMVKLGVKFNSILDNFDIDANGVREDYTICTLVLEFRRHFVLFINIVRYVY